MVIPFLQTFNPSSLLQGAACLILGSHHTGKTRLLQTLLERHLDSAQKVVITPAEEDKASYQSLHPTVLVHNTYEPEMIKKLVKAQFTLKELGEKFFSPLCLVLDDCFVDSSWQQDRSIRSAFLFPRTLKINLFFAMCFVPLFPPVFRTNVDYIFLFHEESITNRNRIYDQYGDIFPNYEVFNQLLDRYTQNHGCLVIDRTSRSERLEDCVFTYRCETRLIAEAKINE